MPEFPLNQYPPGQGPQTKTESPYPKLPDPKPKEVKVGKGDKEITLVHEYAAVTDVKNPQTIGWLKGQKELYEKNFPKISPEEAQRLRTLMYNEESKNIKQTDAGDIFFLKQSKVSEEPSLTYLPRGSQKAETLIDAKTAGGFITYHYPSPDGRYVAYGVAKAGSDNATLRIYDLQNKVHLKDQVLNAPYVWVDWEKSSSSFYYTAHGEQGAPENARVSQQRRVFRHKLGDEVKDDKVVFADANNDFTSTFQRHGNHSFVRIAGDDGIRVLIAKTGDRIPEPKDFSLLAGGGKEDYFAQVTKAGTLIQTSADTKFGKVLRFNPETSKLEAFIPEKKDYTLRSISQAGDYLAINYLKDAKQEIHIFTLEGKPTGKVIKLGSGRIDSFAETTGQNEVVFAYSNLNKPYTMAVYDIAKGKLKEVEQDNSHLQQLQLREETIKVKSKDGTDVVMTIIRKDGAPKRGTQVELNFYGGFNQIALPAFSAHWKRMLEDGNSLAFIYPRGGGEQGEGWYRAARGLDKPKTIEDISAGLKKLITMDYSDIVISGGSNGGLNALLVGQANNKLADQFRVVAKVPLTNMLEYLKPGGVTASWIRDFGDPENDLAIRKMMLEKFSPQHNLKPGEKNPVTLLVPGSTDNRVIGEPTFEYLAALQNGTLPTEEARYFMFLRPGGHGPTNSRPAQFAQLTEVTSFYNNKKH
jgi:prolyl oligopeptidase